MWLWSRDLSDIRSERASLHGLTNKNDDIMKNSIIIMFVVVIFAGGCKNSSVNGGGRTGGIPVMNFLETPFHSIAVDDVSHGMDETGLTNVKDIFDSVSFVKLSNEPEATLGGIDQIELKDSLIVIRDCWSTRTVKLFSSDGKYIRNIGNYGRGPGEYLEPTFMQTTDLNIIVWDQFNQSLLFYGYDGEFQRALKFPYIAMKFHYIDDDHVMFNTINSDNDRYPEIVNYTVFESDSLSRIAERGFYRKKNTYENLLSPHNFFERNGTVYYHPPYCDTLYSIDGKGGIRTEYAFDFGRKTVPEKLRRGNRRKELRREEAESRYLFMDGDVHLTKDFVHFGYTKAHAVHDCIYSNASRKLVTVGYRGEFFPLVFLNITGSTDDAFIGYFFPALVQNQLEGWKKIPYDDLVSQFGKARTELGFSMKPEDNPVITFFYPSRTI